MANNRAYFKCQRELQQSSLYEELHKLFSSEHICLYNMCIYIMHTYNHENWVPILYILELQESPF